MVTVSHQYFCSFTDCHSCFRMEESVVDLLKETAMLMVMVLYHWLVAIVKSILPASLQAKDISGETVLITGAGTQN